jgi:hypothetical protein
MPANSDEALVQIVQPDGGGDVLKPYLGNDLEKFAPRS